MGENILTTFLCCGPNPVPQREPPEDDEKSESGLLTED